MSSLTDSISLPVAPGVPETRIPRFGLGVYESEGEDCYNSVLWALEVSRVHHLTLHTPTLILFTALDRRAIV